MTRLTRDEAKQTRDLARAKWLKLDNKIQQLKSDLRKLQLEYWKKIHELDEKQDEARSEFIRRDEVWKGIVAQDPKKKRNRKDL